MTRPAPARETLLLTASDVRRLLPIAEAIAAVEKGFRLHAAGESLAPAVLGVPASEGSFHVKAAGLSDPSAVYFAAKCNGNFPANPAERGLPTIQGVVVLCDATDGRLLAVMDSMEITALRTAAATAVAAGHLAAPGARRLALCGCGVLGRAHLAALATVFAFERLLLFDSTPARAVALAEEARRDLDLPATAVYDLAACRHSEILVTCTPSREPFLTRQHVAPGAFVAAVGADNADKQELEPALLTDAAVIVDTLDSCATSGELHHALAAGLLSREQMRAELHEVVGGLRPGRLSPAEIVIFDSTGTAVADVAAAAAVYQRALATGAGTRIAFGA